MLEKYIKDRESFKSVETKLRQVFGLGERSLSSREKENFERWTIEWQFGIDVIKKAYEITVDKISKPSVPYVNKILSNWQSKGYKTVDDVEGAIEAYREKKNESEASGFDTNEFFELAIKRAYKTMAD